MKYHFYIVLLLLSLSSCFSQKAEFPTIIEVIDMDYRVSEKGFKNFCYSNAIDTNSVYKWENHWIIYSQHEDTYGIVNLLEKKYPHIICKVFEKPFYIFNREKITGEQSTKEWTNIIMTANLVADTMMQKEYMEYHRTQFEKWPEISKGFCNADFQQLLVFHNGRQLMLVISIPKGKTLDELNPQTTKNNPRVDEWNNIMAKYQVGIEDAPKGTTWVMFQPLH
jgi:hypothetical protein